jgi:glutamate racemase
LATIGVFDSGIGGLTVLHEALRQAPGHHYIYLADSANAPYGEKSSDWVAKRSLELCHWLVREGCQALVVACNTATAQAIAHIRNDMPAIPIIGVEPGIKPAAHQSTNQKIGVLATQNTLKSDKFNALLNSLKGNCEFVSQAGLGLVPLIEEGKIDTPETEALLREHLIPLQAAGIDTLVLGCTHYPFLLPLIRKILGDDIQIIDTSAAVVKQLTRKLEEFELLQSPPPRTIRLYSTMDAAHLYQLAQQLIPTALEQHTIETSTVFIS